MISHLTATNHSWNNKCIAVAFSQEPLKRVKKRPGDLATEPSFPPLIQTSIQHISEKWWKEKHIHPQKNAKMVFETYQLLISLVWFADFSGFCILSSFPGTILGFRRFSGRKKKTIHFSWNSTVVPQSCLRQSWLVLMLKTPGQPPKQTPLPLLLISEVNFVWKMVIVSIACYLFAQPRLMRKWFGILWNHFPREKWFTNN